MRRSKVQSRRRTSQTGHLLALTAWLAHLLGDPVIGKAMLENIAAARTAAEERADGAHDYHHSANFRHYPDRKLLDGGSFVPVNIGTDGFQFFRQNGLRVGQLQLLH